MLSCIVTDMPNTTSRHTSQTREEARKLRHEGVTLRQISTTLNVPQGTLFDWVKDIKLTSEQVAKSAAKVSAGVRAWHLSRSAQERVELSSRAATSLADSRYLAYIHLWKNGTPPSPPVNRYGGLSRHIRRYIFSKFDNKCAICGWAQLNPHTGRIPLEVDHIDGDWRNNEESNLNLLCPNCHAVTSSYGALNKGKGRNSYYKLKWQSSEA